MKQLATIGATMLILIALVAACDAQVTSQAAGQSANTPNPSTSYPAASAANQVNWPSVNNDAALAGKESAAVEDTIRQADKVQMDAEWGGYKDLSLFPTVFTDEPAVPPVERQRKFVQQVRAAQGESVASLLKGEGFLTCMIAGELNFRKADENWQKVLAKAKSEGRDGNHLTPEEQRALDKGVVNGAGSPPAPDATRPAYVAPRFDFKAVKISANYADVTYDDGTALVRAFLVKTSEGWKIAGRIVLNAHL